MSTPRRHHQVPKFYLRRFAADDRLEVVTRRGARATAGIGDAAVQEHFFSYVRHDGVREPELEEYLAANVDTPSAPTFRRIAAGEAQPGDLGTILRFMAFQVVRSPRFRDLDLRLAESLGPVLFGFDVVKKAFGRDGSMPWDDAVVREVFESARSNPPAEYTAKPDSNALIRIMLRWTEQLEAALAQLCWAVGETERDSFITSDNPVVTFRPAADPSSFHGVRPDSESEVRFPLDPRHVLLGAQYALGCDRFDAPPELVRTTNILIARECQHAVFHRPGPSPLGDIQLAPAPPPLLDPTVTLRQNLGAEDTRLEYPALRDDRLSEIIQRTQPPDGEDSALT
jgi:hypothetical protein